MILLVPHQNRMSTPDHPAVRTKGFQKPQPAPKKTAKEQVPTQPEAAVSPLAAVVPNVPEVKETELPVTAAAPPDVAPPIEETAPPAPAATPATTQAAVVVQDSAKGGVRVSQGFAKISEAVEQRNAAPVEVPAAAKTAVADYTPDLDAERVCRRQWWKYNLYVKSGRQAAENPKK